MFDIISISINLNAPIHHICPLLHHSSCCAKSMIQIMCFFLWFLSLKRNLNASRPSEHPCQGGGDAQPFRWDDRLQRPKTADHIKDVFETNSSWPQRLARWWVSSRPSRHDAVFSDVES